MGSGVPLDDLVHIWYVPIISVYHESDKRV